MTVLALWVWTHRKLQEKLQDWIVHMGCSLPYGHLTVYCKMWGGKSLELARWCFWKLLTGSSGRGPAPAAPLKIIGCQELNENVSEKQIRPLHSVLYRSIFKPWQQEHARDRQGCVHHVLSFGSSLMLLFFLDNLQARSVVFGWGGLFPVHVILWTCPKSMRHDGRWKPLFLPSFLVVTFVFLGP